MKNNFQDDYGYMQPLMDKLSEELGTTFHLLNTGGGCICARGEIEGGYLLVGSAEDGPLMTDEERRHYRFHGGFGVGVYDEELNLSYAVDYQAQSADDLVGLAKRAMAMAATAIANELDYCMVWRREASGLVAEDRFGK